MLELVTPGAVTGSFSVSDWADAVVAVVPPVGACFDVEDAFPQAAKPTPRAIPTMNVRVTVRIRVPLSERPELENRHTPSGRPIHRGYAGGGTSGRLRHGASDIENVSGVLPHSWRLVQARSARNERGGNL